MAHPWMHAIQASFIFEVRLDFDFSAEKFYKFTANGGITRPRWGSYEVFINHGFIGSHFNIFAAGEGDVRAYCRISGGLVAV